VSDAYPEPLDVTPLRGAVLVADPRGVRVIAITPDAALITAERLIGAARLAASDELPPLQWDQDY
jgi:hypothetical protein